MNNIKIKRIFLGFDFYGAGNVGDDLMLHGFLKTITDSDNNFKFACAIPQKTASQRIRFPNVEWLSTKDIKRGNILKDYSYWVGVGDTPFQMTSGPWIIDKILDDIKIIKEASVSMFMIGVGGEKEALKVSDKIKQILKETKFIATRDEFTHRLLIEDFGADKDKIFLGSDLAHIALEEIFSSQSTNVLKKYDLAMTYYLENKNDNDSTQINNFLNDISKNHSVVFVGNETRKGIGAEYDIYQSMFMGIKNIFKKPAVQYFMPDYELSSTEELVRHFQGYKVCMSSRYHSILAAAWAGCKVAALGRSSKIKALADELNIPFVENPFNYKSLHEGFMQAKEVPKAQLKSMAQRSRESVLRLMEIIS